MKPYISFLLQKRYDFCPSICCERLHKDLQCHSFPPLWTLVWYLSMRTLLITRFSGSAWLCIYSLVQTVHFVIRRSDPNRSFLVSVFDCPLMMCALGSCSSRPAQVTLQVPRHISPQSDAPWFSCLLLLPLCLYTSYQHQAYPLPRSDRFKSLVFQ